MANLRGGNFEKQAHDAFHRLEKFGIERHGNKDNFTHSLGLAKKREGYIRDIKKYSIDNKLTGKLNQIMSNKTVMDRFLDKRIENLSPTSKENYLRGYSSMLQGLKQANISIGIDKAYFDKKVALIVKDTSFKTGRAIANPDKVVEKLYKIRYESGVIGQVQRELALRTAEAIELVKNHEKYILNNNIVSNLKGKGNHIYAEKNISNELKIRIQSLDKVVHENTYRIDFKEATEGKHIPHDMRFTFAKENLEAKILDGIEYKEAMKQVSAELNHVSAERTRYYLVRA